MRGILPVLASVVLALMCGACAEDSPGGDTNGALESVTVAGGLSGPTAFAFVAEGRIFVTEQKGLVRVIQDGELLPAPLIDIRERVNAAEQRGLLGLAVDPDFASNGYVYLFYSYEHNPSDPDGPKTSRLVRLTVEGDVALPESEQVILGSVAGTVDQPSCEDFAPGVDCLPADNHLHIGGALQFASDGKLFVATGDSAHNDELRVRAQNLDSLAGKVLRINPDGSAPRDNPFFTGDARANRSRVWAYGLREPFRFGLQPETDLPFVGDVGSLYTEEISIAYRGANLGWPCYEGLEPPYLIGDHQVCRDLIQLGPEAVSPPLYTYTTEPSAAVVAGDFAQSYPEPYAGAFFFADFVRSWIAYLTVDDAGDLVEVEQLPVDAEGPVALETSPDGEIYYLSWYAGELRHLRWVSGS